MIDGVSILHALDTSLPEVVISVVGIFVVVDVSEEVSGCEEDVVDFAVVSIVGGTVVDIFEVVSALLVETENIHEAHENENDESLF